MRLDIKWDLTNDDLQELTNAYMEKHPNLDKAPAPITILEWHAERCNVRILRSLLFEDPKHTAAGDVVVASCQLDHAQFGELSSLEKIL